MTQQDPPDSNYLLPYNEAEIKRLRLQHDLIQPYMGGLIPAPINLKQKGLKILESGTFDGIQAGKPILVSADISPTMLPQSGLGSTGDLSFHVQSVTEPWPETWKGTFDLVHQRLVLAGTTPEVGQNAVRGLAELAKPGSGYVQLVEGTLEHLTEEQKPDYSTLVARMLPGLSWNQRVGLQVREWLEAEGLQGVSKKIMEIPVGAANSDHRLGDAAKQNLLEVVEHFATAAKGLPDDSDIQAEDFGDVLRDIKVEVDTVGRLLRFNAVWGRRP
ncbi:N-methyltransferase gliN [Colletotrichum siamense]|nr:N-methyltransferase gliN [Colletotrichum siamense]